DRNEAESANDSEQCSKNLYSLEIDLIHSLIRRGLQEISGPEHVEKEWCVICRRRDVERVGAKQSLVLVAACDSFELRTFGKTWCQHEREFHVGGELCNAID